MLLLISPLGLTFVVCISFPGSESDRDKYLLKYVRRQSESEYTLLHNFALPGSAGQAHITQMMLHGTGKDAIVFIGTTDSIYRVPVQSCSELSCEACVASADPFCRYNSVSKACEATEMEVNASAAAAMGQAQQSQALCLSAGSGNTSATGTPPTGAPPTGAPPTGVPPNSTGVPTFQTGQQPWVVSLQACDVTSLQTFIHKSNASVGGYYKCTSMIF